MVISGVGALRRIQRWACKKQPWEDEGTLFHRDTKREERKDVVLVCVPLTWKPVWSAHPPEGEEGGPFKYRKHLKAHRKMGKTPVPSAMGSLATLVAGSEGVYSSFLLCSLRSRR